MAIAGLLFLNTYGAPGIPVSFDLSKTASAVQTRNLTGTCLPIWNNAQRYKDIKKGLMTSNYRLFRFPNGSLSNGYHWNGSGSYTADGIWVCDSTVYKPGFESMTRNRGTCVNNFGFSGVSKITDGDTSTFWRSDELVSGNLPYFYLELPGSSLVDSIVIVWGQRFAADFDIDFFSSPSCPYPGPYKYQDDFWTIHEKQVSGNDQLVYASALPQGSPKYVRVIVRKFKDQEKSVEVKEAYLFAQGKQVSVNVKKYTGGATGDQTRVIAMPTHEGNDVRPDAAGWTTWHFEPFMDYIKSINDSAVPVICVNYGTGTPQEAAAWVYYANKVNNYNVRFWQIGNEMDGDWEEGGPVNALIYAEKFLTFAKAMKQVDSTIKIFGPLLSNADFYVKNSGVFDGKSWMQSFMSAVGAQEKADGKKYCDGIDFHSYPYYSTSPKAADLFGKTDYVYDQSDSLASWIPAYLEGPDSVMVMLSEYNSSVVMSDMLQKPVNGIFVANMFAGLAEKFGDRAMSVFWDSYEGVAAGPNGTYGSLSLFNDLPNTIVSSFTKAPSAAYWALFAAQNLWLNPEKENVLVQADFKRSDNVRAFGVKTGNDFRALLFNISPAAETLTCIVKNGSFDRADVFTWGESQFKWNGSGAGAYAFPNCGPSSYTVSADSVNPVVVPGQGMCVARFYGADSAAKPLAFVHSSISLQNGSGYLNVCGSVYGENTAITGIDCFFDSSATGTPVHSCDAGFDGPFESFFDSLSLYGLRAGAHMVYIKARNDSKAVAIDSFPFGIMSPYAVRQPLSGTGSPYISERRSSNRIRFSFTGFHRGMMNARIFAGNGKCVREIPCVEKGGTTVAEWSGEDAANKRVSPGIYFLIVRSNDIDICKRAFVWYAP